MITLYHSNQNKKISLQNINTCNNLSKIISLVILRNNKNTNTFGNKVKNNVKKKLYRFKK